LRPGSIPAARVRCFGACHCGERPKSWYGEQHTREGFQVYLR
jgi:hypothetical protein